MLLTDRNTPTCQKKAAVLNERQLFHFFTFCVGVLPLDGAGHATVTLALTRWHYWHWLARVDSGIPPPPLCSDVIAESTTHETKTRPDRPPCLLVGRSIVVILSRPGCF